MKSEQKLANEITDFDQLKAEKAVKITRCPIHGEFESKGIRLNCSPQWVWERCPKCDQETAKKQYEKEKLANAYRTRKRNARLLNQKSAIPLRYQGKRFDDVKTSTEQQRAIKACCEKFVAEFQNYFWPQGIGLTFYGANGLGKTMYGSIILEALFPDCVGCYVTMPEFLQLMRFTGDSGHVSRSVRELLAETPLLVFDEFVQAQWPNEQEWVRSLFDKRYLDKVPTILITNLSLQALKKLDEALFSRLHENSCFIPFTGKDYRIEKNRR